MKEEKMVKCPCCGKNILIEIETDIKKVTEYKPVPIDYDDDYV